MAKIVVLKSSLNPDSKSDQFADLAYASMQQDAMHDVEMIDLKAFSLPLCDGGKAYSAQNLEPYKMKIEHCDGVFLSAPIYNYDVNAGLKNFIELTGQSWKETVVAMSFYAGGERSYMSPMSLMNSLMLDFRCLVLPNYLYVSDKSMQQDHKADIHHRLEQLLEKFKSLCQWRTEYSAKRSQQNLQTPS